MPGRGTGIASPALRRGSLLITILAALAVITPGYVLAAGPTELVNVRSNGKQGDDISGRFDGPAISADGLVVAFDSQATNLVGGDNNGVVDIFVRDRTAGRTTAVSVSSRGKLGNGSSAAPAVSGDGRFVVFRSNANNLVPGDTNQRLDVFVHDRLSGDTLRVSVASDGTQGDGSSLGGSLSFDGRFVAFASDATNLIAGGEPFGRKIYVHDMQTGVTERVARDGAPPVISADGRFVAYGSFASDIVTGDTNQAFDVFLFDRVTLQTRRVSVATDGTQGDQASTSPSISADGQLIAFSSDATNLVTGDTNDRRDVFVHDALTGTTERVSVDGAGAQANGQSDGPGIRGGTTGGPEISTNGRFVAFDSIATNLIANDTNTCSLQGGQSYPNPGQCPDIFVRDRLAGSTIRVSVDSAGVQSNGASTDPAINADGSVTAFFSVATNLVPGDTNTCPVFQVVGQCADIFVHTEE